MSAFLHIVNAQITLTRTPVTIVTYCHLYESEIMQNWVPIL